MEIIKLKEKIEFHEQFRPQILHVSPGVKVPMICLEPGQEIPAHPSGTGVFYALEGKGIMYLEDKEIDFSSGCVEVASEGSKRGVKGVERIVVVAIHVG